MANKLEIPLSNIDLNRYIKEIDKRGINIFEMDDIQPNTDIETIYKHRGHCTLFVGPKDGGHWISTLRNPNKEVFFIDSFGEDPSHYGNNHFLECMKKNGIKKVYINKTVLQDDETMTCGYYSVILICLNKMGVDPSVMVDFLKNGGKKYGSVDNFLLKLTEDEK